VWHIWQENAEQRQICHSGHSIDERTITAMTFLDTVTQTLTSSSGLGILALVLLLAAVAALLEHTDRVARRSPDLHAGTEHDRIRTEQELRVLRFR
jgi:hypothetical protein